MIKKYVSNDEACLIELIRKSEQLMVAIRDIKNDTSEYLESKGFSRYKWESCHEYPGDKHQRWVVTQMEKQISEKEMEKELIDAKIVNLLKHVCDF